MIKPKYREIREQKFNRTGLNNLTKEVQKSRIAVENITKFVATEGKFKDQINNLQEELQNCITNIAVQSKRQKVLNQLILILKGQMFQYQATKKKEEEEQQTKRDKLISKYQYEVDQILQKYNEEIAKIHSLKDLTNSRRSQRVVYSSLFKKLQKEIKQYEEIYKEQLILGQYIRSNPVKVNQAESKYNFKEIKQEDNEVQSPAVQQSQRKSKMIELDKSTGWNGFLTLGKESKMQSGPSRKFFAPPEEDKIQFRATFCKEEKFTHTKELLKQISQTTTLIDKIKIHSECKSTSQILEHYSYLQNENKDLLTKIQECDCSIEKLIKENKIIKKKFNEQEIAKTMVEPETSKYEPQVYKVSSITEQKGEVISTIEQIAQICGIQLEKRESNGFTADSLKLLDIKLQQISKACGKFKRKVDRKSTVFSEAVVDCILQKMEKFNSSEKIMDRGLLQQEYYRELGKKRQVKSRKDASR